MKPESGDLPDPPCETLVTFMTYVKGKEERPGKASNCCRIVPFLPYILKTAHVFVADLVMAWQLLASVPNKPKEADTDEDGNVKKNSFLDELRFLEFADAALDVNKAIDQTMANSVANLQRLDLLN